MGTRLVELSMYQTWEEEFAERIGAPKYGANQADLIGRPYEFKVSYFPIKWVGTTAAPVRIDGRSRTNAGSPRGPVWSILWG